MKFVKLVRKFSSKNVDCSLMSWWQYQISWKFACKFKNCWAGKDGLIGCIKYYHYKKYLLGL